ncbi:MAG: hypothetical protein MR695_07125 [Solobacterium sp.]|nr:hypothetical protein [Solobacterium sp.]
MNEIKENVINKNFMIAYDFSDNDFGGHIEDAIETWVDKWNSVVSNIKTWLNMRNSLPSNIKSHVDSNSEVTVKYYLEKLDKLEDVTNISKFLANGVVASVINRNNDFITYSSTNSFQDIDTCMKKAREYVDYLNILDTSEYHKGSIKDVTNFILDKYKNMQSEGEGYDLEHTWLNGEVLIIKVENGIASAWIQ